MENPRFTKGTPRGDSVQGEESTLGRLLDGERARLLRMVDLRIDRCVKGRFSASDIVQETFLEATRRWNEHLEHPEVPLDRWLRFLARQQIAAHHRLHARDRRDARRDDAGHLQTTSPRLVDEVIGRMTSPSEAADRAEIRGRVGAALGAMDPVDREVLILRQFEGLSNADAASEIGLSPEACSKRYVRALERLGSLLRLGGATLP